MLINIINTNLYAVHLKTKLAYGLLVLFVIENVLMVVHNDRWIQY
jgi:hypothetical protein